MNDVYFNDLEKVVKSTLSTATKNVRIAIAWIKLDRYLDIFMHLLKKGVNISIIIDDNKNNNKYIDEMKILVQLGASIKKIKMPNFLRHMHEKFCIIDNCKVLSGSYNWTDNANMNFENINYLDDPLIVDKYNQEFNKLNNYSNGFIRRLQQLKKCKLCNENKKNIMVISKENYCQSRIQIVCVCGCDLSIISTDYEDINIYENIIAIQNKYSDLYEDINGIRNIGNYKENILKEYNFIMEEYLYDLSNIIPSDIIHAIGIPQYKIIDKDGDGEYIINILWKEKFIANEIDNEYPID